jgi:hypothetical protein
MSRQISQSGRIRTEDHIDQLRRLSEEMKKMLLCSVFASDILTRISFSLQPVLVASRVRMDFRCSLGSQVDGDAGESESGPSHGAIESRS